MLAEQSIPITGGAGSFGKAFVKTVLQRYPDIKRLVIFSRDELKQFEMEQAFSAKDHPGLTEAEQDFVVERLRAILERR